MTFSIIIGRSGGFYLKRSESSLRLCLWCIAFTISFYDMDRVMERCHKRIKELEKDAWDLLSQFYMGEDVNGNQILPSLGE